MKQLSLRGEWGPDEFCPFGAYATAIELKVDLILMTIVITEVMLMMDLVHQDFD